MKKKKSNKLLIKVLKGAGISFIVSLAANLVTFGEPEHLNVIVGVIIGTFVYLLFHIET